MQRTGADFFKISKNRLSFSFVFRTREASHSKLKQAAALKRNGTLLL